MHRIVMLLAGSWVLAGCGGLAVNPLVNESRHIQLQQDAARTLTVVHEMVYYDDSPPHHALRFPAGVYMLEGQDSEYWYMRASAPLDFTDFRKGARADSRVIAGGLMIGKVSFRAVPAAGYIDGEGTVRIMIWKLGSNFTSREGTDWKKSF